LSNFQNSAGIENLKKAADSGAGNDAVLQEKNMTFSERMKEMLDQGVAASKDFASKAGEKAQELGERGVLMLEIKQLENQAQKLISRLGNETYRIFAEQGLSVISADDIPVKGILTELSLVRESIEKKEAGLQNLKKK